MFKVFYSLAKTPFSKEVKTEEAYPSTPFSESMARLDYVKKTRGMGLFVGEPGAGKTFTLRSFSESLNPSLYKVIYFPLSTGTVTDFYRALAFGLICFVRFNRRSKLRFENGRLLLCLFWMKCRWRKICS